MKYRGESARLHQLSLASVLPNTGDYITYEGRFVSRDTGGENDDGDGHNDGDDGGVLPNNNDYIIYQGRFVSHDEDVYGDEDSGVDDYDEGDDDDGDDDGDSNNPPAQHSLGVGRPPLGL